MIDLAGVAVELSEALTDLLGEEQIGYLDVLDALATVGVTLAPDTDGEVSRAYATVAEMEGQWAA